MPLLSVLEVVYDDALYKSTFILLTLQRKWFKKHFLDMFQTCPSDGVVLACGSLSSNSVEQVKGVTYSLDRFLGPDDWPRMEQVKGTLYSLGRLLGLVGSTRVEVKSTSADDETDYIEHIKCCRKDTELYQAVVYLAPGDYHRFHSPTEWTVTFRRYFPGLMFCLILWI